MGSSVKLGFVGCGDWAQRKYLPLIRSMDEIDVIAVSSLVYPGEKQRILNEFPNTNIFDTHEELCAKGGLDGIVITLPHALHFSAVKNALSCGIPVLVDKPLSISHKDAQELVNLALQKNTALAVSSPRRAQDFNQYARQLVQQKEIGAVSWIQMEFMQGPYIGWEKTWRNNPKLSGRPNLRQGILLDTGYHLVDSLMYILGYILPETVYAVTSRHGYEVDIEATAILEFPNEMRATVCVSRLLAKGYNIERTGIWAADGYFMAEKKEIDQQKSVQIISSISDKQIEKRIVGASSALVPFLDFINYLRGAQLPSIWDATATLPTLRILDALYESSTVLAPVYLSSNR